MGDESDASLVRRCLRHEPEAIRALIERFQSDVLGLCVRILGHRHDAEDAAQEVFVRVFRSLGRWDDERPLKPWVLGIAVNRCRTAIGQRTRRPELADHLHETAAAPPADDSLELAREIDQALALLRPEYRTAFTLYHEHGQPYDYIAGVLGRPVGTVKTWLHRARHELLAYLRERGMVPDFDPTHYPT